jgi:hypothetical protein
MSLRRKALENIHSLHLKSARGSGVGSFLLISIGALWTSVSSVIADHFRKLLGRLRQ